MMMQSGAAVARAVAVTITVTMGHTASIMDPLSMIRISVFGCGGSVCSIALIMAVRCPVQTATLATVLGVVIAAAAMLEMQVLWSL